MSFPDPATFFKGLGIAIVIVLLVAGLFYWIFVIFKKVTPNLKFWLKYKLLKTKYNEQDVERLLDYHQAGLTTAKVKAFLLINGIDLKKADELCYIYNQIKKLKGGVENE